MEAQNVYLNCEECIQMLSQKEVYIFGTGIDAEALVKKLSNDINILAFVDNYRYGEGCLFYDRKIINLSQCMQQRMNAEPIIIASYRFAKEISEQLQDAGLRQGVEFFVWDDMHLFHFDDKTDAYIRFLKDRWNEYNIEDTVSKVLIPFDNRHDLMSAIYAYCGNYFSKKYNAAMYGYLRFGMARRNASEVIEKIYQSFNVKDLVDSSLNEEQRREADKICNSIWSNLYTWEDWKNITVYGIHFGTTIIRNLLRIHIPCFDVRDEKMYLFLSQSINTIVFWHHYIFENDIKVVLLADGVSWDGYIRDIAITKGIPTYALCYKMAKMRLDYCDGLPVRYFDKMWDQLTLEEQNYGIEWAKKQINKRMSGGTEEVVCTLKEKFTFAEKKKENRVLEKNEKMKVLICPHIFEEDCYWGGEQIFDDNYFSWLCHLGELSEMTPEYDWYMKLHPFAKRRDIIIYNMILKKYPKIKGIPSDISPFQLKEEGVRYALTVAGTIGHEFPQIGIQVINAGINPHYCFDFTWNPKTKEEYDNLILHLDELEPKEDKEGLYKFYCLYYLYYDWRFVDYSKLFFENPVLAMDRLELESEGKELGTWKYKEYIAECTRERHECILNEMEHVFAELDEWRPDVLYKNREGDRYGNTL